VEICRAEDLNVEKTGRNVRIAPRKVQSDMQATNCTDLREISP
jgi:hypothetical protein